MHYVGSYYIQSNTSRFSLFFVIMQRWMVLLTDVSGHPIGSIFKGLAV